MTCTSALAIALLTLSTTASRERGPRGAPTDAEALISRALELRRAGHPTDALALLRQAHDHAPSARTLGHMGLVETSLQMWSDADAHLTAALATPADHWVRQNRAFLADAQARTQIHVGELAVAGPPGARVWVGGKELGRLPLRAPLRLAEGDVRVTATADGQQAVLGRGHDPGRHAGGRDRLCWTRCTSSCRAAAARAVAAAADDAHPGDRRRWIGGALAAAGAGALLWGIVWLRADGGCEVADGSTGQCLSVYSTGTAGWVLTAGGAAMLLAGGALLYAGLPARGAGLRQRVGPFGPASSPVLTTASARHLFQAAVGAGPGNTDYRSGAEMTLDVQPANRRRVDRYELLELIGEGGMGAVYRALDTRLGRTVALKTVLTTPRGTAAFNQELRQRFMREALAASKVEHRNVVQVIDFGVAEDGTPYLVMEYLRGTDLAGLLKDTPNLLPIEQVADIMLNVCAALRACHQAGIVHRDLKPSNIFLAETDTGPAVKVLDFGVSKAPDGRRSDAGGADPGHAPVPVARAGERQGRAGKRPVRARRSAVRLPDEPAAIRGAPEPEPAARDRGRAVPGPRFYRAELPEALEAIVLRAMHVDGSSGSSRCTRWGRRCGRSPARAGRSSGRTTTSTRRRRSRRIRRRRPSCRRGACRGPRSCRRPPGRPG